MNLPMSARENGTLVRGSTSAFSYSTTSGTETAVVNRPSPNRVSNLKEAPRFERSPETSTFVSRTTLNTFILIPYSVSRSDSMFFYLYSPTACSRAAKPYRGAGGSPHFVYSLGTMPENPNQFEQKPAKFTKGRVIPCRRRRHKHQFFVAFVIFCSNLFSRYSSFSSGERQASGAARQRRTQQAVVGRFCYLNKSE